MSQGTEFLTLINEKLKHKIQEVNHALSEGQKEIESMHIIGTIIQRWINMGMKILITSKRFFNK